MDRKSLIYQDFLRGMVKLLVLHRAGQEPVYGGALRKSLHGLGFDISPGSLYPLLRALEKSKLLRCRPRMVRGRVGNYLELTGVGRLCLAEGRKGLAGFWKEVVLEGRPI